MLYIVLNLDQLAPQIATVEQGGPATRWHGSKQFNNDWPIGVEAALYCLSHIVKDSFVAKEILKFEEGLVSLIDDVVLEGEEVDVEIRCVCHRAEHRARSSVSGTWKPKADYWPDLIMLALN